MLLRSLRIVHFRGIPDLHVKHLGESGVQGVPLPAGTDPSTLAEALRFAFLGRTTKATPWISAGEGFVFVEVAFRTREGGTASIFRGADRRGASQVSLREEDGARISSGADDVRTRFAELAGTEVESWESATFLGDPAAAVVPVADSRDAGPGGAAAGPDDSRGAAIDPSPRDADPPSAACTSVALAAIERLRRSLRASALASESETALRELVALTHRLRGEREVVASALSRRSAARESEGPPVEVRGISPRPAERPSPATSAETLGGTPGPSSSVVPSRAPIPARVETLLGTAALVALGALLLWASSPEHRSARGLGALLTVAFLATTGACAWVAWRRRSRVAGDADSTDMSVEPAREPEPTLVRRRAEPRVRVPEGPANPVRGPSPGTTAPPDRASRLQARLEAIDGALAQAEISVRRARFLVRGTPSVAETGGEPAGRLVAGESPATALAAAADLADRICRLAVERDALLARDAAPPRAAAVGVEAAFARLARIGGDESRGAAALARHSATADALEESPSIDGDALAESLRREVERLGAAAPGSRADRSSGAPAGELAPPRVRELAGVVAVGASKVGSDGAASASPGVGARTDAWHPGASARVPGGTDRHGIVGSPTDGAAARERAWLAARLRRGDAVPPGPGDRGAMVPPRAVILDRRPVSLATDADLAAFVAGESPRTTQIVVGSP